MDLIKEIWEFLKTRKKLWLAPIIFILMLFGGLLILFGTVVPFHLHNFLSIFFMYILGISAFYHDSAACLIKNGKIIASSRRKILE